jgi:hypothetical protein
VHDFRNEFIRRSPIFAPDPKPVSVFAGVTLGLKNCQFVPLDLMSLWWRLWS